MQHFYFKVTLSIELITDQQEHNVYHREGTVAKASVLHNKQSLDESSATRECYIFQFRRLFYLCFLFFFLTKEHSSKSDETKST